MNLQELFTEKAYSAMQADTIVYARDASAFEGLCKAVVWPTSKEQIIHMLKFSVKEGMHFTIRGAATNTIGACVPANSVVIDMSRMNHILDWEPDAVLVEAGVILGDLLKKVQKKRLFFPIKPLEYPVCTIGGMLALNTYGLETHYGRIGDWVEELEVIDGNGNKVLVSGTKMKDFLGAEGSTGIITHAKLKLLREKKTKTISIFKFHTLTALMDKALILDKNSAVMSIEFFDEACSQMISLGQDFHLIVEYSTDSGLIKDEEEIAKIDELKEKLEHILVNKRYPLKEDPSVPIEQCAKFLHWLAKNGVPCYGHLKLRILHPCFREGSKLPSEMYILVQNMHGDVAGQYGIGLKRKKFLSAQKKAKFKSLKDIYDPNRILNRGGLID